MTNATTKQQRGIALVTGAGSGIGRASARALAADGWTVVAVGRRLEPLQETLGDRPNTLAVSCDISDEQQVDELFVRLASDYGRLDLLFNNAGIFPPGTLIDEMSVSQWRQAVDINLTGAFLCARAAFGLMRRQDPQGGRIINNGSISAHAPRPLSVAYTTTKHAITGLTKQLSLDGRPFSIACGQIDIGNAASEMTTGFGAGALQADGSRKAEPLMPMLHVADAVVHMASLPLQANVQFMTIMATNMPFVGRG
jgi:NAD(P)-dependent dehydrogenase (short-subunit alcohol dehydrogenase family)